MNRLPNTLIAPGGVPIPSDRRYHREHIWILPQPGRDRQFRIGLSAYACRWGIEVYFIEHLPAAGTVVRIGDEIGRIETEKTVMAMHAPFSGRIIAINEAVLEDPTVITFDNYGRGWIVELEGEPADLWSAEEYLAFLETLPPPQCFARS